MINHFDTIVAARYGLNVAVVYFGLIGFKNNNYKNNKSYIGLDGNKLKKGTTKINLTESFGFFSRDEIMNTLDKMERNGMIDIYYTDNEDVLYIYPHNLLEIERRQFELYHQEEMKKRYCHE